MFFASRRATSLQTRHPQHPHAPHVSLSPHDASGRDGDEITRRGQPTTTDTHHTTHSTHMHMHAARARLGCAWRLTAPPARCGCEHGCRPDASRRRRLDDGCRPRRLTTPQHATRRGRRGHLLLGALALGRLGLGLGAAVRQDDGRPAARRAAHARTRVCTSVWGEMRAARAAAARAAACAAAAHGAWRRRVVHAPACASTPRWSQTRLDVARAGLEAVGELATQLRHLARRGGLVDGRGALRRLHVGRRHRVLATSSERASQGWCACWVCGVQWLLSYYRIQSRKLPHALERSAAPLAALLRRARVALTDPTRTR